MLDILGGLCYYNSARRNRRTMNTKEVWEEAKNTYLAIMQERNMFSTDKQWNYYLSEIVNQLIRELSTNLWEETFNEEENK